jgi:hypothetical protein
MPELYLQFEIEAQHTESLYLAYIGEGEGEEAGLPPQMGRDTRRRFVKRFAEDRDYEPAYTYGR